GYVLDADPLLAHEDLDSFIDEVFRVFQARVRVASQLLRSEPWDAFMVHIMETDRINHFLWRHFEQGHPTYRGRFLDFYRAVDRAVGQIADTAGDDAALLVLSDHGFSTARAAVFLNTWLAQAGWLRLETQQAARPSLADLSPDSRAYCLDPSRFYLRVAGREPGGFIQLGPDYEEVRDELGEALLSIRDPDGGTPVVRAVYLREELYRGVCFDMAPDLVAEAHDGYDLRGRLGMAHTFDPNQPQTGMHQFRDAFWLLRGAKFADDTTPSITDGGATVLALLNADLPRDADGVPRATR
ncbi:MAG: alkaline phosphatase family protein, partial [Armatimonadetes bacterium]|nr:alkaline phosphatase family protein [Armatimonadota bacterium]